MPRVLEHLEPKAVFHFFEDLTRIPHGSRNTKAISDYCAAFARARGLWVYQDELNNVIIKKPASAGYEAAPAVILQGHLDMVAEKTPESPIDMTKDALDLQVEGDYVSAKGSAATTASPSPWRWRSWTAARSPIRRSRPSSPSTRRSAWRARRGSTSPSSPPAGC